MAKRRKMSKGLKTALGVAAGALVLGVGYKALKGREKKENGQPSVGPITPPPPPRPPPPIASGPVSSPVFPPNMGGMGGNLPGG